MPTPQLLPGKSIHLLPNAFTTAALFAGFFAIIAAMQQQYVNAAMAIIAAGFLDAFDGRIARITNTESSFGQQYDNLSDMVSFGVAPAILAFTWAVEDLGKLGWAAAFFYAACTALRLGRFVAQIDSVDPKYFVGIPSPAAAGIMATCVWSLEELQLSPQFGLSLFLAAMLGLLGLLMVSTIPFLSSKKLQLRGKVPFLALLIVILLLALVLVSPSIVLFGCGLLYITHGFYLWLSRARRQTANPE